MSTTVKGLVINDPRAVAYTADGVKLEQEGHKTLDLTTLSQNDLLTRLSRDGGNQELFSAVSAEIERRRSVPASNGKPQGLYCQVADKGGVSVYGLQRMPVTLYKEQWDQLYQFIDEVMVFIGDHEKELVTLDQIRKQRSAAPKSNGKPKTDPDAELFAEFQAFKKFKASRNG